MDKKQKPLPMITHEVKESIIEIINKAGIPMCCITPIVKDIYEQCIQLEKTEYEKVKTDYESNNKETKSRE